MVKTNQDIIGEQCIRNDDSVLAVGDEYKKVDLKSYHEKLLNTDLAWDRNSLSQVDIVSGVPRSIDKDMVGE